MKLLSLAILLLSSLPVLAQFGAQAVAAGRWEPRNYTNSLGLQLSYCTYWTNGLTLNGSGVSVWTNRLANGFDLAQGTAANQPVLTNDAPWGGYCLYFDGSNDSMSVACAAMVQPTVVIWGGRQVTWTLGDGIFDGINDAGGMLYQSAVTPQLRIYAGANGGTFDMTLGLWGVVSTVFNGASSSATLNKGTVVAANSGASSMTGVRLGGRASYPANQETFGIIVMTNTSAAATNYARLGFLGMAGTK